MAETIAPEYEKFIDAERKARRLPAEPERLATGDTSHPIFIERKQAAELLRVAARRASGLFHATRRTEVVWVAGDSELAVIFNEIAIDFDDGMVRVAIPVRCDQTGDAKVEVFFSIGSEKQPAGLYASTFSRPNGPEVIIGVWGEALVAYAWQCVLGLVSGIAGAMGKDQRGNVLVPVEMTASRRGLQIVPMARHRFAGSSGLKPAGSK